MADVRSEERPALVPELLLVGGLFLAYRLGRWLLAGDVRTAMRNAGWLWHLERAWHLPDEARWQAAVLGHHSWLWAADAFYAVVHFPATLALLTWAYLCRPAVYRWARSMLAWLTVTAFVVHAAMPLAPPRLLPASGMVDTGATIGPAVYGSAAVDAVANQYAAMPSLHVGWALVVALALVRAGRGRWRWLWLIHPVLTLMVVIVTANHYWADGLVAGVLLLVAVSLDAVWRVESRPSKATKPVTSEQVITC